MTMASMAEIYPLQVLLASVAGWMNRRQGEILEYLIEENRRLEHLYSRAASTERGYFPR